jgi:hypothetical protein
MRGQRSFLPAIALLSIVLAGCDSFSILGQFKRIPSLSLTVQKSSVQQGETISLYPTGGTPPYSFGVVAGNIFYSGTLGSVSSQSYTAGTSIGTVTIHLIDADGNTADSTVTTIAPAPTGFTAGPDPSASPNDVDLSWSYATPPLISGFAIERSLDGVTFTSVTNQPSGATFFLDQPLSQGVTYFYRIYAVSGSFRSLPTSASVSLP